MLRLHDGSCHFYVHRVVGADTSARRGIQEAFLPVLAGTCPGHRTRKRHIERCQDTRMCGDLPSAVANAESDTQMSSSPSNAAPTPSACAAHHSHVLAVVPHGTRCTGVDTQRVHMSHNDGRLLYTTIHSQSRHCSRSREFIRAPTGWNLLKFLAFTYLNLLKSRLLSSSLPHRPLGIVRPHLHYSLSITIYSPSLPTSHHARPRTLQQQGDFLHRTLDHCGTSPPPRTRRQR